MDQTNHLKDNKSPLTTRWGGKVKASLITVSGKETNLIARKALISQMTPYGFELSLHRHDLVLKVLKYNTSLNMLCSKNLSLYIPAMDMDLEGTVITTDHLGQGVFKIQMKFLKEQSSYFNECLCELWPGPVTLPGMRAGAVTTPVPVRV